MQPDQAQGGDALAALPFESIVAQCPDAVIFTDRRGSIRAWNRAAAEIFGFEAREALGQSLDIIIPDRLRRAHWSGFERAVASGRMRAVGEVRTTRAIHKDGRRLYVDLSFGLVCDDANGDVIGVLATGRDGSARFAAEKALRERLAQLEAPPPTGAGPEEA